MRIILYLTLIALNAGCTTIRKYDMTRESKMVVSFQDFFTNDTVTCKLNKYIILNRKILNSRRYFGNTGVTFTVTNDKILLGSSVLYENCTIDLGKENTVTIVINGIEENFKIDLLKGIYIGFNKKDKQIYFNQSIIPFEYD